MPITRQQFDRLQRPLGERILDLLAERSEQALSLNELIEHCEGFDSLSLLVQIMLERQEAGRSATLDRYRTALSALVEKGAVAAADVRGTTYYGVAPC